MTDQNSLDATQVRPEWWRPVWICLVGEQPLPNVLPILPWLPERVVFLHTALKASREAAQRCAGFLKGRGVATSIHLTQAFDPAETANDVLRLAVKHDPARILLNYTGGTKPMSLAAYNALPAHIPRVYFDSRMGLMVNQGPFQALEQPRLSVADVLALHASVEVDGSATSPPAAPLSTAILEREFCKNPFLPNTMRQYRDQILRDLKSGRAWKALTAPVPPPFPKFPALAEEMVLAMAGDGLLEPREGFIPTPSGLSFLEGFWWEGVVASRILKGFASVGVPPESLDYRTNLTLRWTAAQATTLNEVDMAVAFRNRLYLISCTTASESETEKRRIAVEALTDRLGGHFGKAMLASTLGKQTLDKLRARSSDRLLIPELGQWSNPQGLLRKWIQGDAFPETRPVAEPQPAAEAETSVP